VAVDNLIVIFACLMGDVPVSLPPEDAEAPFFFFQSDEPADATFTEAAPPTARRAEDR